VISRNPLKGNLMKKKIGIIAAVALVA